MYRPPLVILNVQPLSTPLWSESFIAHPRYSLLPPSGGQSIRLNHSRSAPDRLSVHAKGLAGHDQSHLLRACASIRGRFFQTSYVVEILHFPWQEKQWESWRWRGRTGTQLRGLSFSWLVLGLDPHPHFPHFHASAHARKHTATCLFASTSVLLWDKVLAYPRGRVLIR